MNNEHGWDSHGSRAFWTRRRRTAASLITVMAVLGGLAAAFSLFDRTVANNVVRDASSFAYEIWKRDPQIDGAFVNTANGHAVFEAGPQTFPGDTRTVEVKIRNTNVPAKDATFELWIDPAAIEVTRCSDLQEDGTCAGSEVTVDRTDPMWAEFVGFWTLSVDKQAILDPVPEQDVADPELNETSHEEDNLLTPGTEDESGDPDDTERFNRYLAACEAHDREPGPRAITDMPKERPCVLGNVEGFGSDDLAGEAQDVRYFRFGLTEQDTGEDQSEFKGWALVFDMVFQAHIPARPEGGPIER